MMYYDPCSTLPTGSGPLEKRSTKPAEQPLQSSVHLLDPKPSHQDPLKILSPRSFKNHTPNIQEALTGFQSFCADLARAVEQVRDCFEISLLQYFCNIYHYYNALLSEFCGFEWLNFSLLPFFQLALWACVIDLRPNLGIFGYNLTNNVSYMDSSS